MQFIVSYGINYDKIFHLGLEPQEAKKSFY